MLKDVIDIEKWQALQDAVAEVTQFAIITVDYKGNPVTTHSRCSEVCRKARENPELLARCLTCDARGGLEAVRTNAPYIYHCHMGIVDIAIPIVVEDQYLGAIMAGQVRLVPEEAHRIEVLYTPQHLAAPEAYEALPEFTLESIASVTEMLRQLSHFIVSEAVEKHSRQDAFVALFKDRMTSLSGDFLDLLLAPPALPNLVEKHKVLKPAFDYIAAHKDRMVSLDEVAAVCYISPGYFSRLFKKETGVNFSTFLNQMKLSWAEELLLTTQMTVAQISDALGYSDVGYFIKKFKAHRGTTPKRFRT